MNSKSTTQRIEFTTKRIRDLPVPQKGGITTYDALVPKLAVVTRATGSKVFYAIIWNGTKKKAMWLRIARVGDISLEDARKEASKLVGRYASGEDPAEARRAAKRKYVGELTLGEAFDAYITDRKARKLRSVGALQSLWIRTLGAVPSEPPKDKRSGHDKHPKGVNWERRHLSEITRDDIERLHRAMHATPYQANRTVALLRVIFEHVHFTPNPAAGIKTYSETQRKRFLEAGELPSFYGALTDDDSEDFRDFVNLALLTGARSDNVRSMRFADINATRAIWHIPDEQSKNGEEMVVPLIPQALEIIERRRAWAQLGEMRRSGFVFPANSASGYMGRPGKRWQALLERAKLSDLRMHDLRRTMGSWQANLGASLPLIGKSLGHRSPSSTAIYARLSVDPVRESMQKAAAAMQSAGEVKPQAEVQHIKAARKAR